MRNLILHFDLCSYSLVVIILLMIARAVCQNQQRFSQAMQWAGIWTFLAVGAWGLAETWLPGPIAVLGILTVAGTAGCVASLTVVIVAPPIVAAQESHRRRLRELEQQENWQRRQEEEAQKRMNDAAYTLEALRVENAHQERMAVIDASRPPPPSSERLLEQAQAEFQERMAKAMAMPDAIIREAYAKAAEEKYRKEVTRILG